MIPLVKLFKFYSPDDTQTDTKAADVMKFDRAMTLERKVVLETTDYEVPLDLKQEQYTMTNIPGILMSQKLNWLLASSER